MGEDDRREPIGKAAAFEPNHDKVILLPLLNEIPNRPNKISESKDRDGEALIEGVGIDFREIEKPGRIGKIANGSEADGEGHKAKSLPFFERAFVFEAKNLYSYKGQVSSGKISASIAIAFDPSVLGATTIRSYFNDLSNQWDTGYFDMADGFESGFPGTSSLVGDMSFSLYGALPNLDVRCGYLTIRYDLVVKQKVNPSRYQIKSYDASDALLGTTVVTATTDRSSLVLPSSRAYSFVEEYQGDALKSTSERIGKGEQYPLYFSNSAGFFDYNSSMTVL